MKKVQGERDGKELEMSGKKSGKGREETKIREERIVDQEVREKEKETR